MNVYINMIKRHMISLWIHLIYFLYAV